MSLGSSLSLCGGSALGAAPGSLCVAPRAPRVGAAACAGSCRGAVCARLHLRRQARLLRLRCSRAGAGDGAGEEQASAYGLPGLEGLSEDDLPTQGRAVVSPQRGTAVAERDSGSSDLAYLSVRACGSGLSGQALTHPLQTTGAPGHSAVRPARHRLLRHAQHGLPPPAVDRDPELRHGSHGS